MLTSYKYSNVSFGDEAINKLMEGVNLVCNATSTTLGPRGKNVAIDKGFQIVVLHDGVSVSESVKPRDPYTALGAKIVQEAAKKQRDFVGDGTTAVMVLAQAILKEAIRATAGGVNSMALRKEIEEASKKVISKIEELSSPIKDLDQKVKVATISAEDEELGKLVAETIHKVGEEGIVTVEESKAPDTVVDMQDGMQIDKGYAHPFMVTDPERMTAVLEDAYVLATDIPLTDIHSIAKFLETKVLPNTRKVLFISPEISGDFLNVLLNTKMEGKFVGIAVRAPGVAQNQVDILQDICAMTGAKFVSKDAGMKFSELEFEDLGHAQKIVCSKISTIITGGSGRKEDILKRTQLIKSQGEDPEISEFDKQKLRERFGKLTNGIAVIKVGGETEVEMNERKERAIDAVAATQAAVHFGIVPGGETVYLTAREVLEGKNLGEKILYEALARPFKKLVENAGFDGGQILAELSNQNNKGFDVTDGQFKEMIKSGIIDPTSVSTNAIKTAVSVSIQLITCGACVVPDELPEDFKK